MTIIGWQVVATSIATSWKTLASFYKPDLITVPFTYRPFQSLIFLQARPDNGSFHVSTSSVIGTSGIPFTFTFDLDNIPLGAALLLLIEFDLWLLKLCMRH
jgi:hypothetical protein